MFLSVRKWNGYDVKNLGQSPVGFAVSSTHPDGRISSMHTYPSKSYPFATWRAVLKLPGNVKSNLQCGIGSVLGKGMWKAYGRACTYTTTSMSIIAHMWEIKMPSRQLGSDLCMQEKSNSNILPMYFHLKYRLVFFWGGGIQHVRKKQTLLSTLETCIVLFMVGHYRTQVNSALALHPPTPR